MAQPPVQAPPGAEALGGAPFPPDLHDARHLWLKAGLLLVWLLVSFVACYFVRELEHYTIGPWPMGYWIAAQGAVLVFIAIVFLYCWAMNRFEREDADTAAQSNEAAQRAGQGGASSHG